MELAASTQDGFYGDNPTSKWPPPANGWGCDSDRLTPWFNALGARVKVPSCVPDPSLNPVRYPHGGAFRHTPVSYVPTIMDRLHAAGLSWKIYGATKGQKGYGVWDICPTFAECLDTRQNANLVPDARFTADAAAGNLPTFSIVAAGGSDFMKACHNLMSITACDNWVGTLTSAVMNGPDWSSTALFITFDDFGGFYDQVPPATEPDGTPEGTRVPLIIVSPYARPGYTDRAATTFAGILAYTEHIFGLSPLGVNDANAYDFSGAFNYSQLPLHPVHLVRQPIPPQAARPRPTKAMLNDPT